MKKWFHSLLLWRLQHVSDRGFLLILSVLIGFLAGLTAGALKTGVFYMHKLFQNELHFDSRNYRFFLYPFIGITATLLFREFVLKDHIGHNISSILHAIAKRNSIMRLHKVYSSVTGAILTAGFGGSIGLEAPIISSGSAIGSNIAKVCRLNYKSITTLLGCGAAGGIAAIFNTPIAGIVFALEVLLLDLTRFSLIPLLMASVSGAITSKLFFSDKIFFDFITAQPFMVQHIHYYILLGILAGLVSVYFTKVFLWFESIFETIRSRVSRLFIGTFLLGLLLFIFPALYGEGYELIKAMLSGQALAIFADSAFSSWMDSVWAMTGFLLAMMMLKVFATSFTIGAGGIGGIFAPSLFTGAILGFLFAYTNNYISPVTLNNNNFALVGMASVLGGVLNAPLTGIFLIAELTHGYELIVPLMLATTLSFVVSKYLSPNNIVTAQLVKRGEIITHHKDKAVLHFLKLKTMVETDFFPIYEEATLEGLVKAISLTTRNIFPVINQEGMLMGIILLDDVREIMFNTNYYSTSIVNLMHLPPTIINIDEDMEQVMHKFKETDAWNLPVCENGRYIGFVSKSKLFSAYRSKLIDITEE
ncbi:MAG: chloride channel protein [Salinivirgaceae bacterium]|nr:chloride channel protein [Salinivirgaceae bacterium]